jgi:plasmid stabilization system protein ParE
LKVVLTPPAVSDLEAVVEWYDEQRDGLGAEFATAFLHALDKIGEQPLGYQRLHRNVCRYVMRRFSYVIYYQVEADRVLVEACMHGRRSPTAWPGHQEP